MAELCKLCMLRTADGGVSASGHECHDGLGKGEDGRCADGICLLGPSFVQQSAAMRRLGIVGADRHGAGRRYVDAPRAC